MLSNDTGFAKKGETEKATPGIFSILGVVVLDILILFLFWFIAMIALTAIWTLGEFISGAGHIAATAEPGATAQLFISLLGMYLAISVLCFWRGRALYFPPVQMRTHRMAILSLATGAALFFMTMLAMNAFEAAGLGSKPGNQEILQNLGKQWPVATVFFTVLLAPVFEELFFRKLLFTRLARANSMLVAYVLSSLLFALMHEPWPVSGAVDWLLKLSVYAAMGAVFAWVYRKTGKLWPAILAHATNNLLGMLALLVFT